ncbi:hypothetical protein EDC04DRAFT_2688962 [Pisolithus marmoratus]|nr:hypothetical protein EDC04DRAFT_2688962 [Pisolithus marmoratus]
MLPFIYNALQRTTMDGTGATNKIFQAFVEVYRKHIMHIIAVLMVILTANIGLGLNTAKQDSVRKLSYASIICGLGGAGVGYFLRIPPIPSGNGQLRVPFLALLLTLPVMLVSASFVTAYTAVVLDQWPSALAYTLIAFAVASVPLIALYLFSAQPTEWQLLIASANAD